MSPSRDPLRILRVLIWPASAVLIGVGIWQYVHGLRSSAIFAFVMAALGLVSLGIQYVIRRRGLGRESRAQVELHVDPSTALRWAEEAVRELGPEGEVQVDAEQRTVSGVLPRTWKSWGEQVTAVVRERGRASTVEISSKGIQPWVTDFGKNGANVRAVVGALAFLHRVNKE